MPFIIIGDKQVSALVGGERTVLQYRLELGIHQYIQSWNELMLDVIYFNELREKRRLKAISF